MLAEWDFFNHFDDWVELEQIHHVTSDMKGAFVIGYRFRDDRSDKWTRRFNSFNTAKSGFAEGKRKALCGAAAMMASAVPDLVEGLELDPSETVFVPALLSSETVSSEKSAMWHLTSYCAKVAQAGFAGDAITKKAYKPVRNKPYGGFRVLVQADFRSRKLDARNIVIFDDFIWRCDTMAETSYAISEANPDASIYGVALAKTERRGFWEERYGFTLTNDHVPDRWESLWKGGETDWLGMVSVYEGRS